MGWIDGARARGRAESRERGDFWTTSPLDERGVVRLSCPPSPVKRSNTGVQRRGTGVDRPDRAPVRTQGARQAEMRHTELSRNAKRMAQRRQDAETWMPR